MTDTTPQEALEAMDAVEKYPLGRMREVMQIQLYAYHSDTIRQALTEHEKLKAENAALREAVREKDKTIDNLMREEVSGYGF